MFSVVTVVRNDLQGLIKSRASLDSQTCKKWQHIIIDGGSTDGSIDFLRSLPATNTVFISESDSGIYHAMNKGWKMAKAESFVFYLNARDTFSYQDSLFHALNTVTQNPDKSWGCTTHEEIQPNGEGWVCKLVSPPSIPNQLYAYGYRSHQAVIMKASFIKELGGFNEKYRLAADWDLIVRAMQKEEPLVWSYPLGRFELGGESSISLLQAHLELRMIRKEHLPQGVLHRFADDFWCALYLRKLGFRNYLTKIVFILYPQEKESQNGSSRMYIFKKVINYLTKRRNYSGKYKIIGFLLKPFRYFLEKREEFRTKRIQTLQRILEIRPLNKYSDFDR